MTPFEEDLYRLLQDSKKQIDAFSSAEQDAALDLQKILQFSAKWDFKSKYDKVAKDYDELKTKFNKEKELFGLQATRSVMKEFILILDECFMLEKFVAKGSELERAVRLIISNMEKMLTRRGGGIIKPVIGEEADPSKHRFIEAEEVKGYSGNTVDKVFRYGYYVMGQVVREAEVKVKCGVK